MSKTRFVPISVLILFISLGVAQAGGAKDTHDGSHGESPEHHRHHLGFFVGAATNTHSDHTDFAFGLDSETLLPYWGNRFGVGLIGEWVFADHRETLVAPAFMIHPSNEWKITLAPGVLFEEGSSHKNFLMRIGAAYNFHAGSSTVAPTVNFDIVDGHLTIVYGVSIGVGFGH